MNQSFVVAAAVALSICTFLVANAATAYEGRISGEFHGWDGETVYKLMDGHIIQQSEYHYHYHYAHAPRVLIYQPTRGGYRIHVEGDNDQDVGIVILK